MFNYKNQIKLITTECGQNMSLYLVEIVSQIRDVNHYTYDRQTSYENLFSFLQNLYFREKLQITFFK